MTLRMGLADLPFDSMPAMIKMAEGRSVSFVWSLQTLVKITNTPALDMVGCV